MKYKKQLWMIIPFTIMIYSVGIINLLSSDKLISDAEKRELQQRPGIGSIINKEYPTLYETYYTDQFMGRDSLLKLYTKIEILMNKSTIRNYYIINNKWIMPKPVSVLDIDSSSKQINDFAKDIDKEGRDIYYISTPAKATALNHLYPKYATKDYGLENLKDLEDSLDKNKFTFINIDQYFKDKFSEEERESFYFKTDHHWNSLGAYEGFKYIIKSMDGIDNTVYDSLFTQDNYITKNIDGKPFLGSYNRNLFYVMNKDEKVPYVYNKNLNGYKFYNHSGVEYNPIDSKLIISTRINDDELTYGGIYTQDIPLYKVENENAPIKKKVLIIRDSFQAPTTLMFSDVFESVEILDPRNTMGLTPSKVISEGDPDIVIFMFHSETFNIMIDLMK